MSLPRPDKVVAEPATADELAVGLVKSLQMFMGDVNLDRCVGESGRITAIVELQLNRGHVQWTDGAVTFRRRVNF